jgi:hypothetical protein
VTHSKVDISEKIKKRFSQLVSEIAVVTAEPATEFLDEMAMRDLLAIEHWVIRDQKNEHATKVHEYCLLAREAKTAMKAGYFLRRAMVHSKDYMLWDDAIYTDAYKDKQAKRRIGKTKLSESQKRALKREYEATPIKYGALKALARKYDVTDETIKKVIESDVKRD